jgi:hypothetical protein
VPFRLRMLSMDIVSSHRPRGLNPLQPGETADIRA